MLLGLGGFAGSGKDAFADCMIQHNSVWVKTYMSYALEQALLVLDPFLLHEGLWVRYTDLHSRIGYNDSKKNLEVRRLLQVLGTEIGREMFGEDVWVDKMLATAEQYDYVIVTGIRYENELRAIGNAGGTTAWVSRPGVGPVNQHSSDNTITPDMFDYLIENNGTLDDLMVQASNFSDSFTQSPATNLVELGASGSINVSAAYSPMQVNLFKNDVDSDTPSQ